MTLNSNPFAFFLDFWIPFNWLTVYHSLLLSTNFSLNFLDYASWFSHNLPNYFILAPLIGFLSTSQPGSWHSLRLSLVSFFFFCHPRLPLVYYFFSGFELGNENVVHPVIQSRNFKISSIAPLSSSLISDTSLIDLKVQKMQAHRVSESPV